MAALNSSITSRQAREDRAIYRAMHLLEKRLRKPGVAFNSPNAVRQFLALNLAGYEREVFSVLWLDTQHRLIAAEHLFAGTLTQTTVHPREVLKRCLELNAAAVIFAHNHPSGVGDPSGSDLLLTRALMDVLMLVDVKVLDHFIVAGASAVSLVELGLLGKIEFACKKEEADATKKRRRRSARESSAMHI